MNYNYICNFTHEKKICCFSCVNARSCKNTCENYKRYNHASSCVFVIYKIIEDEENENSCQKCYKPKNNTSKLNKTIDDLKWLKNWLESPPELNDARNYECIDSLENAINILNFLL